MFLNEHLMIKSSKYAKVGAVRNTELSNEEEQVLVDYFISFIHG